MAGYSNADDLQRILGPVTITSGDRSPQRNRLVGGVPNSAHLKPGTARDFVPQGMSTKDAAAKLAKSGIAFDQIIDENDHVHISQDPRNRQQVLGPKVANVSDADLLNMMGGAKEAAPAKAANVSDDQLLAVMGGSQAAQATTQQNPSINRTPSATPPVNTFADMLRTVPGALTKGAAMVAGLPGDVNALLDAGANAVTGANISTRSMPTSEEIGGAVSKPFGGFYEPKTTLGKYTDTALQFAPAALAPGNALLRAARVLAPGIASEAAGQATEGSPLEPVARFAGAVAGGGGLSAAKHMIANPKALIPATSEIKAAASAAYKHAEQAGVVIKDSEVKNLATTIAQDVTNAGIDPTLHPKATAALGRLAKSKGDLTLKQMDILRRVANGAAGSMDKDEARIAHIIVDHIDDFVENLGPSNVRAGNTQVASDAIKEARTLWGKQARSTTIDNLIERAKNRAETVGGSGLENALRVEFRGLAQSDKRMARFSADEQKAIRAVARGGPVGNALRTIGKLAPTNLIAILGEMGAIAHDPKGLALPVAGTLGRIGATAMTKRNALLASKTVRSGGKALPQTPVFTPEMLSAIFSRKGEREPQNNLVPSFAQ